MTKVVDRGPVPYRAAGVSPGHILVGVVDDGARQRLGLPRRLRSRQQQRYGLGIGLVAAGGVGRARGGR